MHIYVCVSLCVCMCVCADTHVHTIMCVTVGTEEDHSQQYYTSLNLEPHNDQYNC